MLTRQQVQGVCARYTASDWWVDRDLPADRLANARQAWRRPPGDDVIAFLDATVFGSGKEGLAVLPDGIVWHSGGASKERCEYTWRELATVPVRACGSLMQIGRGALSLAGAQMKREDLAACLRELQRLALAAGAQRAPAYAPEGRGFPAAGEDFADAAEMRALLAGFAGSWLHASPDIPARKERGAREAMRIPPDEGVLALVDATVFGSGKDGLVIGTRGIYWRNNIVGGSDNGRMTWDALARARVMRATDLTILGERDWVNPPANQGENVERLLLSVQWWARARMTPAQRAEVLAFAGEGEPVPGAAPAVAADPWVPESSPRTGARWHLAVDGQSFGPYETSMIGIMSAARQIDPDACHAWTEGMAAWTPLRQVPELAAVVGPPRPAAATADADAEEPVDINHAPLDDLLLLPGMTRAGAELLLRERAARGGFADAEQVGQLLGLQPHQVQRLRARSTFGRPTPPRGRTVDF